MSTPLLEAVRKGMSIRYDRARNGQQELKNIEKKSKELLEESEAVLRAIYELQRKRDALNDSINSLEEQEKDIKNLVGYLARSDNVKKAEAAFISLIEKASAENLELAYINGLCFIDLEEYPPDVTVASTGSEDAFYIKVVTKPVGPLSPYPADDNPLWIPEGKSGIRIVLNIKISTGKVSGAMSTYLKVDLFRGGPIPTPPPYVMTGAFHTNITTSGAICLGTFSNELGVNSGNKDVAGVISTAARYAVSVNTFDRYNSLTDIFGNLKHPWAIPLDKDRAGWSLSAPAGGITGVIPSLQCATCLNMFARNNIRPCGSCRSCCLRSHAMQWDKTVPGINGSRCRRI